MKSTFIYKKCYFFSKNEYMFFKIEEKIKSKGQYGERIYLD